MEGGGDVRSVYRALRLLPKGLEALYPLAGILPPVNRFFLDPSLRSDDALQQLFLAGSRQRQHRGHAVRASKARGADSGSMFRSTMCPTAPGRSSWRCMAAAAPGAVLWSWLRDARSRGAILAAPTSVGSTWALMGPDADTPNIARILEFIRSRWNVDAARPPHGMSDGGTFTYVSGLEAGSPFTHLAPVSAAFHPLLAQMADADRTRGLPIHIIHGASTGCFPWSWRGRRIGRCRGRAPP